MKLPPLGSEIRLTILDHFHEMDADVGAPFQPLLVTVRGKLVAIHRDYLVLANFEDEPVSKIDYYAIIRSAIRNIKKLR